MQIPILNEREQRRLHQLFGRQWQHQDKRTHYDRPLSQQAPRTYYDEYDLLDDGKDEWYATINSCYCDFETHYDVERVLYFGREYESDDNPLRFETNKRELRRAVITTVKQAYNAEP